MLTVDELLPFFRDLFPEFANESDVRVKTHLKLAILTFNKCQNATLYLCAHNLAMSNSAGIGLSGTVATMGNNQASLPLSSMKVDGKSARFMSVAKKADTQYTTTTYGLFFLQLKKSCLPYVFSAGSAGSNKFDIGYL